MCNVSGRIQESIDGLRQTCFASRMVLPAALHHAAGLLHRNRLAPSLASVAEPPPTNGAAHHADPDTEHSPPPAEEDPRLFPATDCQFSARQLHVFRGALARTLDALMARLAPCLHDGASDRAVDTLAAAFVAQRLPPSWLPEPPEDLEGEELDAEEMAEVAAMRCGARPPLAYLAVGCMTVLCVRRMR